MEYVLLKNRFLGRPMYLGVHQIVNIGNMRVRPIWFSITTIVNALPVMFASVELARAYLSDYTVSAQNAETVPLDELNILRIMAS